MIKKNSNTHKIWSRSKCETKKKKIVIDISFFGENELLPLFKKKKISILSHFPN